MEFKQAIKEPAREIKSKITFPDLLLDEYQIQSIEINSSLVFSEDFEIGTAPMDTCNIELIEEPDDLIIYDFEDKECKIELGIKLPDDTIEYLDIGRFTVEEAIKKDNKITLSCVDGMYKAEKEFINDLMFPTTILEILQSACDQSGITLTITSFANSDYVVQNEPVFENITCRHIFAQVAELAGGYAKINRLGELEIITLGNTPVRDITKDHYIDFKRDEVAIGEIDRVIVKVGKEVAEQGTGENIYTIVDNMFVQDPNNVIGPIFNVLKDVSYTACEFNWQGDFSLDLGDKINIDGYDTYVLDRKLKYTGGLREEYRAPAKSNVEKESTGKSNLILDMNNVKTQIKVIEGEITQTIEKVENLVVDAENRLFQSQTQIPFDFNIGAGTMQLFREAYHPYYKVTSNTDIDLSASFPNSQFAENLDGQEVTISLDVLVDVDRTVNLDGKEYEVKGNRWTRIWVAKELPINTTKNVRVRNPFSRNITRDKVVGTKLIESLSTGTNILFYRNLQVQKGDVPTNWTLTPEELEERVTRYSSEIRQLADSISLKVSRGNIISEINQTAEEVKILANKIALEGLVTANEHFQILPDGTMKAVDGYFEGLLTSTNGNIAGFEITENGFTKSLQKTLGPFIQSDVDRVQQILLGNITPTQNDFDKYDTGGKGFLSIIDLLRIQRMVSGTDPNPQTVTFTITINTANYRELIKISSTLNDTTLLGAGGVNAPNGQFGRIKIGNGATGNFQTADGKTVFVEDGIITSIV